MNRICLTDKLTSTDLCIEKKPEEKPEEILVIKAEDVVTLFFDFDKSYFKTRSYQQIRFNLYCNGGKSGCNDPDSGYTDGRGTEEYNKVLSDKRARACADYLLQKGIETGRVSFVSFGACCPIEMELINGRDNPDGRSRNRRALINIKKD